MNFAESAPIFKNRAFAFADGHCETHQWKDGRTLSLYVKYSPGIYGIYQPNNPDIMWVQDRTTAPK